MEDLIKDNFVEGIDKTIVSRNLNVAKIILLFAIIYALFDFVDWYSLLQRNSLRNTSISFFTYRVRPIIVLAILTLSILNCTFTVKGNNLIQQSLENNDSSAFNQGYTCFYKAGRLSMTSFIISIISVSIRLLLSNNISI